MFSECSKFDYYGSSNPTQFGFNVACIYGFNPFDFKDVAVGDGASQSLQN